MAEDALQAAMELLDRMEDSYTELVRKQEQHRLVVKKSNLDEQRHQVTVRENAQLRKQLSIVASKLKLGLKEIERLSNQNAEVNKQLIQSANQWSILNRKLEEQEAEIDDLKSKHEKEKETLTFQKDTEWQKKINKASDSYELNVIFLIALAFNMSDDSADETSTRKTCQGASEAKIRIRRKIILNFVVEKQQLQACHCTGVKQNQPQLVAARFPRHVYNRDSASSEKNCKRAKEKRQNCEMKSRILKLKSMSRISGRASLAPERSASQNENLTTKGIPGKDKNPKLYQAEAMRLSICI
ncbi:hypothetical protein GUITHDRAFT_121271 [Guillardia theta CCMP2712]|uniref:Uncharacterized protein n=1 Tax=Guillardia theta (strain CCMP2712) TaxID=905079 RepID=L1I8Y0_GUITC|nr:hypothetical protein GUITHDRAFT_121271 [Guillardia theta CCMP2712]EKX32562.1 hypothetical protein GUITHDRAFT_121271 [Guillardia theta CCMP2712]|eukprot:XP_005819542.1 hypothetical protein GUITHDRAFT_121271 [Guillardia theta CCMP2712]